MLQDFGDKEVIMAFPFQYVNKRGVAALRTIGVMVNDDNVVFKFQNHAFLNMYYKGAVYIDLAQEIPSDTTTTLPIVFETNGIEQAVTKIGNTSLTVEDITGTGVYAFWYDKAGNILQLIS